MSRRRKPSPLDDLMDAVALFPWWVGALLAVLSYLGLHWLASQPVPPRPALSADISDLATEAMTRGLADAGQYIVPAVCLLAAAVSAWRRRQQARRVEPPTGHPLLDALNAMSYAEFLALVTEGFRLRGYRAIETGRDGATSADLVLHKAGETQLALCKTWREFWVGLQPLAELQQAMAARGATGGWVLTAGRYTDEAVQFAASHGLRLVDGVELKTLLDRAMVARHNRVVAPDMADTVPAWPVRAHPADEPVSRH